MKLPEYLAKDHGSAAKLADHLKVAPARVSEWASEKKLPPAKYCRAIEAWSHGEVTVMKLRPDDWMDYWPERTKAQTRRAPPATENIADAQAAIRHVEAEAVAAIRQEAGLAASEIKHAAQDALKPEAAAWDGRTERRQAEAPWDGVTERRRLNAPIDRRVSPESVARAEFLRAQAAGHKPEGA